MQRISILFKFAGKCVLRIVASVLFALFLGSSFGATFAQQPRQQTFASAEDAGNAFFAAMQAPGDQAPLTILGPAGKDVLSSGDPAEDADARETFIVKYQEMHRFVTESNGKVALVVGAENWPFPIPLANNHGSWYFDTAAGKDEIVFRRIGKNELSAIDARRELVEAQERYFARPPHDTVKQFAQRFVMSTGIMVCTGTVPTMNRAARSTLSSHMHEARRTKLASRFRSTVIFSGSSRAKGLMHRAEPRTMSSMGK